MNFFSLEFILIFLPIVTILYYNLIKYRLLILLLSSQIFYFHEGLFAGFLVNIIILIIYKFQKNLILSCIILLLNFLYLKYSNYIFGYKEISFFNLSFQITTVTLIAGVSFYTFQIVGFLFEKKKINFKHFMLFVLFFPQLIAGPIIKVKLFLKNLNDMQLSKSSTPPPGFIKIRL
jgi:alginate O-acetyltransferase complex protein AlgI